MKIARCCEAITKVDTGSDDRMVRARAEMNKKTTRLKNIQTPPKTLRLDLIVLEKSVTSLRIEFKKTGLTL